MADNLKALERRLERLESAAEPSTGSGIRVTIRSVLDDDPDDTTPFVDMGGGIQVRILSGLADPDADLVSSEPTAPTQQPIKPAAPQAEAVTLESPQQETPRGPAKQTGGLRFFR